MKRTAIAALAMALVGFVALAQAQEKASPVGTWKFMQMGRGGQSREVTMKLKLDGEKLTGTVTAGMDNAEVEIKDGKFKDNELSFNVTREQGGQTRTTKYSGKLDKDTIKGTIETERGGKARSTDWEAKRQK
jgi:hypothetical protein